MVLRGLFRPSRQTEALRLAHALRDVPLFRDLPPEDLVAVWHRLQEVSVPAGAVLMERGQPGNRFFILQSGILQVCLGLDASALPIRRVLPGDFVGEMALLTGEPRSAEVVALEASVVWVLERDDFEELLATSLPLLRGLNRALAERLALTTRLLEAAGGARGLTGLRFGPYRILEQLGAGGMASVYSAIHTATEEAVAIKVLPAAWGAAPDLRARLRREADLLGRLRHQNVVRLIEVGEVAPDLGGGLYLAEEWLPNALDRLLRVHYPDPLAPAAALRIGLGIARGLAACHSTGIVHRDVKPSNVLLRADGTPVLTDFGLAQSLEESGQHLTPSDVVVGTADYISPEQVSGGPVDGRSDLYSLGVVLYEMLAGYVPFAGKRQIETLRAHLEEQPADLPAAVPPAARAIVQRALRKRPEERYATAGDFARAIRLALGELAAT
ncbi:MAG TPA: protein kinase [Solirubrobacterales bacterium]